MVQTKYLLSLIFFLSGGANVIAFGPKLLHLGGAFLQQIDNSLRNSSRELEGLSLTETTRLSKEKSESSKTFNGLKENFNKVNSQIEQSNAGRKAVEEKARETNETNGNLDQKLKEHKEKVQASYKQEAQVASAELQKSATELSQKFKTTWESQDQQIQKILQEIRASNKEKIEKLAKEINELPDRIFIDAEQGKLT